MKNKLLPFVIVTVCCVVVGVLNNRDTLSKDVIIETYDKYMTLQNDGGTHYDTRYEIDMKKRKVVKYSSYYKGFEGLQYKDKVLLTKELSDSEFREFNRLIDDIKKNKDTYSIDFDKTYMPYVFRQDDMEIEIYDMNVIYKIEKVLH